MSDEDLREDVGGEDDYADEGFDDGGTAAGADAPEAAADGADAASQPSKGAEDGRYVGDIANAADLPSKPTDGVATSLSPPQEPAARVASGGGRRDSAAAVEGGAAWEPLAGTHDGGGGGGSETAGSGGSGAGASAAAAVAAPHGTSSSGSGGGGLPAHAAPVGQVAAAAASPAHASGTRVDAGDAAGSEAAPMPDAAMQGDAMRESDGTGGAAGAPAAARSYPRPQYQAPTEVQPKPYLEGYTQEDSQHVAHVFSTGNMFDRGIRSLPDALAPGFRERLYMSIVEAGRRERAGGGKHRAAAGSSTVAAPHGPGGMVPGQRAVPRIHPYSGSFASYEYMSSEYDRPGLITKFERLKHKMAQVAPADFVVKAPPQAPRGAPSFSEFAYVSDPLMLAEAARQAQATASKAANVGGPFLAGGRVNADVNLRGLADECMLGLCRLLSEDWPSAFLQVFEDASGAVVLCFDRAAAVGTGDLSSYMQNFVRAGRLAAEFRLVKDAAQWGLLDDDTGSVFYVLWPPWVRHRYVGSEAAAQPPRQAGEPSVAAAAAGGGSGGGGLTLPQLQPVATSG